MSVTVSVGEYTNFNCSLNCTADDVDLRWRLVAPRLGIVDDRYIRIKPLKNKWSRKGVTIQNESVVSELTGCEVVTIKILATDGMNGAVMQCAAIVTREDLSPAYSKFAVMQVQPLPELEMSENSNNSTAAHSPLN